MKLHNFSENELEKLRKNSGGGREQLSLALKSPRYKNVMMRVEGTNCISRVAKFVIFHSETKELKNSDEPIGRR